MRPVYLHSDMSYKSPNIICIMHKKILIKIIKIIKIIDKIVSKHFYTVS